MSKRILTTIVFLFTTLVFGQGSFPVLEWSPEYNQRDAKFDRILDAGTAHFYTARSPQFGLFGTSRDHYYAMYDRAHLSEEWLVKVPSWEWNGNRVEPRENLMANDVQYLFFESYDRQSDTKSLLCRTLDSNASMSEPKLVEQLDSRRRRQGDFSVQLSKDRSKIAVFTNPPFKRNGSEQFYIRIFDLELNELWNAAVELEYEDQQVVINGFEVSNDGDVYILCNYDENPNRIQLSRERREFFVLKVEGGAENEITKFELGLRNIRIQNIGMECDLKDGQMAVSGFYSKQNFYDMDGAFYILFDQEKGAVLHSNLNPFSADFVAQFNRFRAKRGQGIRRNFVFRQFLSRPDGGSYIVAEDYEVVVRTVQTSRGTTVTNYYYYYNDIVVLSISKDGDIDWYAHIPKKQVSMNDGGYYLGYALLQNEDGLHFIYNDHKKNQKRWGQKTLRTLTNVKNSNLALVTLTHDAEMHYRIVNKNSRRKFRVSPRRSSVSNDGKDGAVLLSLRGTKLRFGNLYFQD
ncbi:MAG: hypothetical protein RL754_229 [Bacteroidota bacterium]|jgi:hypothetical protein